MKLTMDYLEEQIDQFIKDLDALSIQTKEGAGVFKKKLPQLKKCFKILDKQFKKFKTQVGA